MHSNDLPSSSSRRENAALAPRNKTVMNKIFNSMADKYETQLRMAVRAASLLVLCVLIDVLI